MGAGVRVTERPKNDRSRIARTYVDALGDERLRPRAPLGVHPFPHLFCPTGHRIRRASFSLEEDTFRCEHRTGDGATCNTFLYVLADFAGRHGERLTLAVEVTSDEIKRARRLSIVEKLDYFGVLWVDPRKV